MQLDLRKIYRFTPVEPAPSPDALPTGAAVYYECTECSVVVNSVPHLKCACTCGNLAGSGGSLEVKDPAKVKVMTGVLR